MSGKKGALGRALLRDKRLSRRAHRDASEKHTTELDDGHSWMKYQSITQQRDLEEFLATAELADTDFTAERQNVKVIIDDGSTTRGLLSKDREAQVAELMSKHRDELRIPRQPSWDRQMSASDLQQREKAAFLDWRRALARLQESQDLLMTPFERNIEVWRQLWRVVHRSDLLVQIVDARNPLLFRCTDLEAYVREVDPAKRNLLLINKADLLTPAQRSAWADYFDAHEIPYVFWSAHLAQLELEREAADALSEEVQQRSSQAEPVLEGLVGLNDTEPGRVEAGRPLRSGQRRAGFASSAAAAALASVLGGSSDGEDNEDDEDDEEDEKASNDEDEDEDEDGGAGEKGDDEADQQLGTADSSSVDEEEDDDDDMDDSADAIPTRNGGAAPSSSAPEAPEDPRTALISRSDLLRLFVKLCPQGLFLADGTRVRATVGFVGYPNVGKSSTINVLCGEKKVAVAATPGKTKHFQTINLDDDLCLCDCPGLVFPAFATTTAELVCNGILPVDQLRDGIPPVTLICQRIPRLVLEAMYAVHIVRPAEGEDPKRPATASEFLSAYAYMRGFMKSFHGAADEQRAARYVLKDLVNGKLLYCEPPPGAMSARAFNAPVYRQQIAELRRTRKQKVVPPPAASAAPSAASAAAAAAAKAARAELPSASAASSAAVAPPLPPPADELEDLEDPGTGSEAAASGGRAKGRSVALGSRTIAGPKHHMRYANDIDEAFFSQQNVAAVLKNRTTMNNFQRVQGATPAAAAPASTKKTRNGKKVKQRNLTPSY